MERATGFEPATCGMASRRSTTELHPLPLPSNINIPQLKFEVKTFKWRRRPDSNRGIRDLQSPALATWLRRLQKEPCREINIQKFVSKVKPLIVTPIDDKKKRKEIEISLKSFKSFTKSFCFSS